MNFICRLFYAFRPLISYLNYAVFSLKFVNSLNEGICISFRRSSTSPFFCNRFSAEETFMRVSSRMSARSSIFICSVLQPSCTSALVAIKSIIFSVSGSRLAFHICEFFCCMRWQRMFIMFIKNISCREKSLNRYDFSIVNMSHSPLA